MPDSKKYEKILNSLQQLLEQKNIQTISVSEIASNAGMGKGSIYYYFPSKNAILEALIKRNMKNHCKLQNILPHSLMFHLLRVWLCYFRHVIIHLLHF